MARKQEKGNGSPSLADLLDSKNSEMRESFFKNESGSSNRGERLRGFFQTLSNSFLFKTKKSTALVTAIATLIITLGFSSLWSPNPMDTTTLAARISGGVALDESQLRSVVKQIGQKVYWSGPMRGAKYTINAQNFNSIYVRYLKDGKGISDQTPKYRVIATYKEANAYNSTLSAGNQADGISFTNNNGSVVYYNKQVPTNVYVAFKQLPYQIEVFDPDAKTALAIAKSNSDIKLIN